MHLRGSFSVDSILDDIFKRDSPSLFMVFHQPAFCDHQCIFTIRILRKESKVKEGLS